ncbi:hypothetical protein BDW66DRAFT_137181 [Aspergillus desertorum]
MVLAKKHVPIVKKRMSPPTFLSYCPALRVEEGGGMKRRAPKDKRRMIGNSDRSSGCRLD